MSTQRQGDLPPNARQKPSVELVNAKTHGCRKKEKEGPYAQGVAMEKPKWRLRTSAFTRTGDSSPEDYEEACEEQADDPVGHAPRTGSQASMGRAASVGPDVGIVQQPAASPKWAWQVGRFLCHQPQTEATPAFLFFVCVCVPPSVWLHSACSLIQFSAGGFGWGVSHWVSIPLGFPRHCQKDSQAPEMKE